MNIVWLTPALDVYEHMALDEVTVRTRPDENTLRFYNWKPGPAVTFGYAQAINQVRKLVGTPVLCRRPTGGGVVQHKEDLTFSLVFPCKQSPVEIYKKLHALIQTALVAQGVDSRVCLQKSTAVAYAPSQQQVANACFTNPVQNDLLLASGQKMLGGAIRRFGETVLYQGSLQVPGARQNPNYKQALIEAVRGFWQTPLQLKPVTQDILVQVQNLANEQYKRTDWTEKF